MWWATLSFSFAWQGAFGAFVAYANFIGLPLAKQAYKAYYEGCNVPPASSSQVAGVGCAVSLALQTVAITLFAGYATGTYEEIQQGTALSISVGEITMDAASRAGNAAIICTMGVIYLWSKLFPESDILDSFCIRLADQFMTSKPAGAANRRKHEEARS